MKATIIDKREVPIYRGILGNKNIKKV